MAAVEAVCAHLKTMSRPVTTPEEIAQVLFDPVLRHCVPWLEYAHDGFSVFICPFVHDTHAGYPTPTYYELVLCSRSLPFLLTVIPVLGISSGKDSDISL
jgi:hypothetical protein